jgi:predicted RNA binding protein with dsRBD fold (UPF0201 family)
MENLLRRQNERLQLLVEIEEQLERLNALEELLGHKQVIDSERKELRGVMLRIVAWMNGD